MNDASKPSDTRAERLAAQLRANLHRRKAQARAARDAGPAPDAVSPPASADQNGQ